MRKRALLGLYAAAVLVRAVLLVVLGPDLRGDFVVYARVALNMLSGCGVSLSGFTLNLDPTAAGTVCVAHFGGNGLPGYPAFIAAVWGVSGVSPAALLWVQLLVCAMCVPRLAYAAGRLAGVRAGWVAGLVAALSPLQAELAVHPLTEALTCAAVTWLAAELMLSMAARRLRVGWIAAALMAGLVLRLDMVLLVVPVAVAGVWLHGPAAAARRGLVLAALLCVPLGAWTVRNAVAGVPLLPPARAWMLPDGRIGPLGYLAWLKQWVVTEEQRAATMYFSGDQYARIHLVPGPFAIPGDGAVVEALLAALRAHQGEAFPAEIDAAFRGLAEAAARERGFGTGLALRVDQAWGLWRQWGRVAAPEAWAAAGPADAAVGAVARFYRCLLGLGFIAAVIGSVFGGGASRVLTVAALALVVVKTGLGVAGLFLEARYTLTAVPMMELAVVLSGVAFASSLGRGSAGAFELKPTPSPSLAGLGD